MSDYMDPDFSDIKKYANGMLPIATYNRIYDYAKEVQGNIVEVGTAHGAATICLALALTDNASKVYTFEKIFGGSREKFGNAEENLKIINSNYEKFKIADRVNQYIGDVVDESKNINDLKEISLLMLDADGRLDRDFSLFYDRLKPGGYIIIDDCDDRVKVKFTRFKLRVDLKHKLTHKFIEYFESMNYLEKVELIGNTYFGRKPIESKTVKDISILDTSNVYSSLIFTDVDLVSVMIKRMLYYISRIKHKLVNFFK